jgi:hypothetical protein
MAGQPEVKRRCQTPMALDRITVDAEKMGGIPRPQAADAEATVDAWSPTQ